MPPHSWPAAAGAEDATSEEPACRSELRLSFVQGGGRPQRDKGGTPSQPSAGLSWWATTHRGCLLLKLAPPVPSRDPLHPWEQELCPVSPRLALGPWASPSSLPPPAHGPGNSCSSSRSRLSHCPRQGAVSDPWLGHTAQGPSLCNTQRGCTQRRWPPLVPSRAGGLPALSVPLSQRLLRARPR